MAEPIIDNVTKIRNRRLGRALTLLAIALALGTYIMLAVTRFNPFDKPPITQSGGM